jgi:hypothetical protein
MSKRIKLVLTSVVLAVLLVSSAVIPGWVASVADMPIAVMEIAGRGGGGGSFS